MYKTLPVQQTTRKFKKPLIANAHTVRIFSQYLQEHSIYTNSRTKYHLLFIAIKQHTQFIIPITYKYTASVYLKYTSYENLSQFFVIQTFNEAMCADANVQETRVMRDRRDVPPTSRPCSSKHSNLNTSYK
jgi:acyl-CoA thioesterase FadM